LDHWTGGLPQIVEGFVDFVNKIPFYGAAVLCLDHPTVQSMLPRVEKRHITYGMSQQADYVASNITVADGSISFDVTCRGLALGRVRLNMIGRHNVLNALAALAVAEEVGVPFATAAAALSSFQGVGRRFEIKGHIGDILVADDYGHHPAEIRATLEAAREAYDRRLVVAFQPHRYTRTRDLLMDFASAFNASNVLLVADIYAASETPIPGITAQTLVDVVSRHGHQHVEYVGPVDQIGGKLGSLVRPGDLVLTLGAGNIWQAGEELLVDLQQATQGH